jgi:hypothetical protein
MCVSECLTLFVDETFWDEKNIEERVREVVNQLEDEVKGRKKAEEGANHRTLELKRDVNDLQDLVDRVKNVLAAMESEDGETVIAKVRAVLLLFLSLSHRCPSLTTSM